LNANIPRYFIERFLGPSALGGFAVVASIQLIVATVLSAVGQSTAPRMATEFTANHKKAFVRLLYELLAVAMALSCGLVVISVVLGRQVLTFLFRPEYAQYRGLLILLSVVTLVSNVSVCLGFAITAARSYGRIALVYVATSVAIAIGCSVLVPAIGLSGAAWAMLIGSLVCGVGSILIVVDRLRVGPRVIGSVPS
jgi:O-antigen/teichoic acid export membrane protein